MLISEGETEMKRGLSREEVASILDIFFVILDGCNDSVLLLMLLPIRKEVLWNAYV